MPGRAHQAWWRSSSGSRQKLGVGATIRECIFAFTAGDAARRGVVKLPGATRIYSLVPWWSEQQPQWSWAMIYIIAQDH
jgi:hypothetical protein